MKPEIKVDHVIRKAVDDRHVDEGVIVHVDDTTGDYWWIPSQQLDKHGERLKHYIKAPRKDAQKSLEARIDSGEASLHRLEPTGLAVIPLAQLREKAEKAAKSPTKRTRNLVESLAFMDEQWSWIAPMVESEPIEVLLNVERVNAYAASRMVEFGVKAEQIVRAVRAYLAGGKKKEALLPGWERRGAPGKSRYPTPKDDNNPLKRAGRRNVAVEAGYAHLAGIQATPEVREKLRLGYRKYKTGKHISVRMAYTMTLAEYWAESVVITDGVRKVTLKPLEELPTYDQFRRHGPGADPANSATRINLGAHRWQRDHRALPGTERDKVVAAAQWGGMDSTSDDQNLVLGIDRTIALSASSNTKVTEGYTGYILGFHSGFERPSTMTALMAIAHSAESKVEFCKRYGIDITDNEWIALHLRRIRGDNGEHKSEGGINSLTKAQISLEFVQSYAAERKGTPESKHQTLHRASGHQLAGSTQGERHRRGDVDPKKDACRTHGEYMYHAIKAILYHNNVQRVEHLLTLEMRAEKVEPTRAAILKWMITKGYVTTDEPNMSVIRAACLPVLKGVVTRQGIQLFDPRTNDQRLIPHLRYSSKALQATGLTEQGSSFRQEVNVHLNPTRIGKAWLNFRGLVEVELLTHDVQLGDLALREWLEITDHDRLDRYLTKHVRLQLDANDAIDRYDSNVVARRVKEEHQKLNAALGRKKQAKPSKRKAAAMAQHDELQRRLGLGADLDVKADDIAIGAVKSNKHSEPDWVAAARASSSLH